MRPDHPTGGEEVKSAPWFRRTKMASVSSAALEDCSPLGRNSNPAAHPMHNFTLPQTAIDRSVANRGVAHPFGILQPRTTALVVIDMQNYFVAPGAQGEIPMAREIVPSINRLAQAMRAAKSNVIWVQNSTDGTRESWSVMADHLMTPARAAHRWAAMAEGAEGFKLWPELDARSEDFYIIKKRFSAFIQGSSAI